MKSSRKRTWKVLLNAIGWVALGFITLVIVLELYTLPWTGFGDYTIPNSEFVRGKTLWDWMQLLIIPVFLAAGAIAVNRSEKQLELQRAEERAKLEREIATDRQQEAALQSYLDRMDELLLERKLLTTRDITVRNVARVRTLTALRGLDANRKGTIIKFLCEAELITGDDPVVNLEGADVAEANLQGAKLKMVHLKGANLRRANLIAADLTGANLEHTDLGDANLGISNLTGANLGAANLRSANLATANLTDANLENAFLYDAHLRATELEGANLKGAILPEPKDIE